MKPMLGLMFVCMLLQGCNRAPEGKNYITWVRDYKNGFHVKKESDGVILDLQYEPSKFVWMQQNGTFREQDFNKEKPSLDSIQYFILTITGRDGADFISSRALSDEDKNERLYYFSYQFQNDLFLKNGKVTLPCVLFHFERNEDISNARSFVLGFENTDENSKTVKLIIQGNPVSRLEPALIEIRKEATSAFAALFEM